uniref:Uncharacterized protein n=1 Tax=Panagrellus redivivus TaxID=6233 RepID=A0A7E4VJV3_PANRE
MPPEQRASLNPATSKASSSFQCVDVRDAALFVVGIGVATEGTSVRSKEMPCRSDCRQSHRKERWIGAMSM